MRGFLYAGLASISIMAAAPAPAWGPQGHMATGAIAYDDLKSASPGALAEVLRIAASLPERGRLDAALAGLSGEARDRKLFQMLARWPDDVRGTAQDHPAWHYAAQSVGGGGAASGQAQEAYALTLATLRDPAAPASDRAAALAWLFHIVGDMHNPVHAADLFSAEFPQGDFHATRHYVRRGAAGMPLHWLWDTVSDGPGPEAEAAEALAKRLATLTQRRERIGDPATALRRWARESHRLAGSDVYPGERAIGSAIQQNAPGLPPGYVENARRVADQRLALAGHRLALLLAAIFPEGAGR